MSRSQSFLKHAAIYGAGSMMIQAAGFILLPIYTRYLEPSRFGALEIANRLGEIFSITLLVPGIRIATHAFFNQAEDDHTRRKVVCTATALMVAISAVAMCVLLPIIGPIGAVLGIQEPGILRLALAATFLESLTMVPLVISQARLESTYFVSVMFAQFLVKVGLSILFVVGLRQGVWGVLVASVLTSGTFGIGLTVRELGRGLARPDWAQLREIFVFALPFVSVGLGYFLLNDGDRFFLLRFVGETAVGLYAFGYKLSRLVCVFSREPLQLVWSARMYAEAKKPEAPTIFGTVFTRIMGAYVLVGLALCLFQDEVTAILGGREYAGATKIIAPVVLAYGLLAAADLMDAAFYIKRRTGMKFWITLSSTSVMLLLYALMIPKFGLLGAALATLFGFAFHLWLTWRISSRIFPVTYEVRRLCALLGVATSLWLISRLLPATYWMIPVKTALWGSCPLLLWMLQVISPEEKDWSRAAVRQGSSYAVTVAPFLFAREIP